jgi:hypothetical protein
MPTQKISGETLADVATRVLRHGGLGTKPALLWRTYEPYLSPLRLAPIRAVEIGVHRGDSLRAFSSYFSAGRILGLDVVLPEDLNIEAMPNAEARVCDQRDAAALQSACRSFAPDGLDIIIDDASHVGEWSMISFEALFPLLKSGGLYVIEDWGAGYMSNWGDGASYRPPTLLEPLLAPPAPNPVVHRRIASHDYGMVGFVKSLIDKLRGDERAVERIEFTRYFVVVHRS